MLPSHQHDRRDKLKSDVTEDSGSALQEVIKSLKVKSFTADVFDVSIGW